ncbi:CHASE3 domain-containing protein, partial [Cellulomonas sp. P5_C6]
MSAGTTPARRTSTLRRRLRTTIVAAGAALLVVVLGTAFVLVRLVDRQEAVTQTYFDAITLADGAYIQLIDAETAVRGFALTGDPITLEPYDRAIADDLSFRTLAAQAATGGDKEVAAA